MVANWKVVGYVKVTIVIGLTYLISNQVELGQQRLPPSNPFDSERGRGDELGGLRRLPLLGGEGQGGALLGDHQRGQGGLLDLFVEHLLCCRHLPPGHL